MTMTTTTKGFIAPPMEDFGDFVDIGIKAMNIDTNANSLPLFVRKIFTLWFRLLCVYFFLLP